MDVIEPNQGLKIIKEDKIWKSDGTTTLGGDDKAGIACILYAMKYMVENVDEYEDIYAIFTPGEEEGMLGAKSIKWDEVYRHMNPCKNIIVLDNAGPSKFIAIKAPTAYTYKIEVFGKSAHAGIEVEKGINAIKILARIISYMENGRIDQITTANISYISSNFPSNVVPDYAFASGEIRSHEKERVEKILNSYENLAKKITYDLGASYKFSYQEDYPSLSSKDDLKFAKEFQQIYKELGVDAKFQIIGGGSDANFFANQGFNSIIIGVGMEKVHTKEEYLLIDELIVTSKAIIKFMKKS
ncbi:MAG: M20/M25/M40 family metallo-hydrolase [Peptoniphilaceae bacterium]|nr:M20/M25/M40 family metallo-hydrolase [Peptoniphilaceae bacterium]MDY6018534.1 M20/M25/M40 family metallo-hydrolase [Anaerococcus sp.]